MDDHVTPENGTHGSELPGHEYEPPRITPLGTLADLTAGGEVAEPLDGMGGAGDVGSGL